MVAFVLNEALFFNTHNVVNMGRALFFLVPRTFRGGWRLRPGLVWAWALGGAALLMAGRMAAASEPLSRGEYVEIRTDFPGGNLLVEENLGQVVKVAQDQRTTKVPWFYWYFEARALKPGSVTFEFKKNDLETLNKVGMQGPAISTDGGKTWRWTARDEGGSHAFSHRFTKAGEVVRFSSTLPYVQSDLTAFLERNKGNPLLHQSVLTRSGKGREVLLIRIGEDGPGKEPVLLTGRQHANESVASYALEGFMQAALSKTPAAEKFRKKYVLYAVPLTDLDGVEDGDQGKNRAPHDHNRDWSATPLYPETIALMALDKEKNFKFAIDFHCPTLLMDIHQRIYFAGLQAPPAHNKKHLTEYARLIKEMLPPGAPPGPVLMATPEPKKQENKHSHYFGFKEGSIMVCTMEIPFAPPKAKMNPPALLDYGRVMMEAFAKMDFTQ